MYFYFKKFGFQTFSFQDQINFMFVFWFVSSGNHRIILEWSIRVYASVAGFNFIPLHHKYKEANKSY